MRNKWIEVWADEGLDPPYLLILMGDDLMSGSVRVVDPQEQGKVVFEGGCYEEGQMWLLEDEYSKVEGRIVVD